MAFEFYPAVSRPANKSQYFTNEVAGYILLQPMGCILLANESCTGDFP